MVKIAHNGLLFIIAQLPDTGIIIFRSDNTLSYFKYFSLNY